MKRRFEFTLRATVDGDGSREEAERFALDFVRYQLMRDGHPLVRGNAGALTVNSVVGRKTAALARSTASSTRRSPQ